MNRKKNGGSSVRGWIGAEAPGGRDARRPEINPRANRSFSDSGFRPQRPARPNFYSAPIYLILARGEKEMGILFHDRVTPSRDNEFPVNRPRKLSRFGNIQTTRVTSRRRT